MLTQLSSSPYLLTAIILVVFGIIFTITGFIALIKARIPSFVSRTLLGLLLIALSGLAAMIGFGIQGYQTLTREEIAARISVVPLAPQRFEATFRYPDGRISKFVIAGDEIYVDAHIIKWQAIAHLLGLHTAYELDRVGGRYRDIEDERTAERSLHTLSKNKPINLFSLRHRHTFLALLFDAKYGSATFIPVTQPAEFELRVSTTGLLFREIDLKNKTP